MERWTVFSLALLAVAAMGAGCARDEQGLATAYTDVPEADVDARAPEPPKTRTAKPPEPAKPAFDWDFLGLTKAPAARPQRGRNFNAVAERRRRRQNPTFWEKTDDFFKKLFGLDEVSRYNRSKPRYSSMSPARP